MYSFAGESWLLGRPCMAAIGGTRIRGELELYMCHYNAYTYPTSVTAWHYQWPVGTHLQWPTTNHPQSSRFLKFSRSPRHGALQCYKRQPRSMHSRNKENATLKSIISIISVIWHIAAFPFPSMSLCWNSQKNILKGDPYHWMEIFKLWMARRPSAQCSWQRIKKQFRWELESKLVFFNAFDMVPLRTYV